MQRSGRIWTGFAAIALAVAFNVPFSLLAARFDYPAILRKPAGDVLAAFAAGGPELILIWYAFALCALAMLPFAVVLAFALPGLRKLPVLALGGALAGGLAGVTQAIGLLRWVFVIPHLARLHDAGAARAFDILNLYGGVAIGEHLGQILTCLWVLFVALHQIAAGRWLDHIAALLGFAAIAGIGLGLGEGLSIALGQTGGMFGAATVLGYMAFSLWLIVTGLSLLFAKKLD